MDDKQCSSLIRGLTDARKAKHRQLWRFITEAADGGAVLIVGRAEAAVDRAAQWARKTAKDARKAEGWIRVGDDKQLIFVKELGSVPLPEVEKAIQKQLGRLQSLDAARTWLQGAEVVEGGPGETLAPGDDRTDLGIASRSAVEGRSKASRHAEKKLSDYVQFLESLEGWQQEFGAGVAGDELGRARASLDQIEAAALRWKASHKKGSLEGSKNKKRRKEVDTVLGQVAEARRRMVSMGVRDGTTPEDRQALLDAEKVWMAGRIEEHEEEFMAWGEEAHEALDDGRFGQGAEIGVGSYGRVVLLEDPEAGHRLVAKFQTAKGRDADPRNLEKEAELYERAGLHPNIVRSLGVRDVDGEKALVLDAVEGGSFDSYIEDSAAWLAEGKITPLEYAAGLQQIVRGIARGLTHLHSLGLFHRDVKPENVMVDPRTGEAVLIDLGTLGTSGALHATGDFRDGSGGNADIGGLGMSTFEAIQGTLPGFRPERTEVTIEEAIAATHDEYIVIDWDELSEEQRQDWRKHMDPEQVAKIDTTMESLQKRRAKGDFWARNEAMFEQGEGSSPKDGLLSMVGEMHKFVNRVMSSDPDRRPSSEELLTLPFLSDSILSEEDSASFLRRLPELRGD